jgi:hypothetical protein
VEGLELCFLRQKRRLNSELPSNIKEKIEIFEDELIEMLTENKEELFNLARSYGIHFSEDNTEVVGKLLYIKEQLLLKEADHLQKEQQEREMEKRYKENLLEIDLKINDLRSVIRSFQKSYKKINDSDVDGVIIDTLEYQYLGCKEKIIPAKLLQKEEVYDDLDGEPI